MKDFFRSLKFKIFAVVALLLIGLMIRTALSGGMASLTASAVSFVVTPLQKLSSTVSDFFAGVVGDITSLGSLKSENERLKKEIGDYQTKLVDYNEIKRENDSLEAAFDLHKNNPDFKLKPATVISRSSDQWYSSFVIDRGSMDGINTLDVVLTADNVLAGKVMRVYAHSAVVATVLDPSVPVGILVSETGDPGQTEGELELLSKGRFRVGYLKKDSGVAAGDMIVTSGRGGVFPRNIRVGTVESVEADQTGATLTAVCKPLVTPADLKNVFVLTDFNGKDIASASEPGGK